MVFEQVRQELLDGGLHEESVERLLDHYQRMQGRLAESEYDEAGTHIGNFCENMVNILRDQMGESIESRPSVGTFVDHCTSGNIGSCEPDSIRVQLARTLRTAYDIRNNRDSVHVNLTVPVNYADTQAGIAMCSWMLAEILRVYGDGEEADDMEEIGELIEELAEPVGDRNPLTNLLTSHADFDRSEMADTLDGLVQVYDGKVRPDTGFTDLSTSDQVAAVLLARRAAVDLNQIEEPSVETSQIGEYAGVTDTRIRQVTSQTDFIQNDDDSSGYHIPGFRVQEALDQLHN